MQIKNFTVSLTSIALSLAIAGGVGIPAASAADANPVEATPTVMNGPLLDVFKKVGNGALVNEGGFSYDPVAEGIIPANYTKGSLQVGAGVPGDLQWSNHWILNGSGMGEGSVAIVDDVFYWGGNLSVGIQPTMSLRYKDINGNYVYFEVAFNKVKSPNTPPTASPDYAEVKVGETVRTYPFINDTAGLNTSYSWQETFRFDSLKLQDPADQKWKRSVTVPDIGVYTIGFDDSEYRKTHSDADIAALNADGVNAYMAQSVFVDFTATKTLGTIPDMPYRFWNGIEPADAGDNGSGTGTGEKNSPQINFMTEVSIYTQDDLIQDENGNDLQVRSDNLIPSFCIPSEFLETSVTPEAGTKPDDWTVTITDKRQDHIWQQLIDNDVMNTNKLQAGDNVNWRFIEDVPGYTPSMKVVSQDKGTLVINYHSDVANSVNLTILPCQNSNLGTSQMASSVLSYKVTGAPVATEEPQKPKEPVISTIPETPKPEVPVEEEKKVLKDGGEDFTLSNTLSTLFAGLLVLGGFSTRLFRKNP